MNRFSIRGIFFLILVFIAFGFLGFNLYNMQITSGSYYKNTSDLKTSKKIIYKAPRGRIYDRNGVLIADNECIYELALIKISDDDMLNKQLGTIYEICSKYSNLPGDSLPFDRSTLIPKLEDEELKAWLNTYYDLEFENIPSSDLLHYIAYNAYGLSRSIDDKALRWLAGARYEIQRLSISGTLPITLYSDFTEVCAQAVFDSRNYLPDFRVLCTYQRKYYNNKYLTHIIGNVGKIDYDEYENISYDGYELNDYIGKQGIEKSCEKYLRGTDGQTLIRYRTDELIKKERPIAGNDVYLTVDLMLQTAAEDALKETVENIRANGYIGKGADADSGAAVVIDVNNGDILVCASYPSYDLNNYNQSYNELIQNPSLPLLNRAVSGTYSPGSTFKPLVAIAAMENGSISPEETIEDKGIYDYYEDYRPRCWLWSDKHITHGKIDVSQAIEHSCNYYFYEAGRRTGIDVISDYASSFGFGQLSGCGLPEEVKGTIANPENKKRLFKDKKNSLWYGADTLQASIGQSVNSFTPIQLANYTATIANGGTRYKLNSIKKITKGQSGKVIEQPKPYIQKQISIGPTTLYKVKEGMRNVTEAGSAEDVFRDYPVSVGGKTGTAQVGNGVSNNALFVAFAPFDKPEIAVCVIIEHGVSGANAAQVAKRIFDCYFGISH